MSWSPDLFIGELRPWPDTVHVVRGKTEETRRYVPEDFSAISRENVELRELVRELHHELDAATQYDAGGARGVVFEFADRMREMGIEVDDA